VVGVDVGGLCLIALWEQEVNRALRCGAGSSRERRSAECQFLAWQSLVATFAAVPAAGRAWRAQRPRDKNEVCFGQPPEGEAGWLAVKPLAGQHGVLIDPRVQACA